MTDRRTLDLLYARVFGAGEGRAVLAHLRARTIEQPCFTPGAEASHGFFREGQNSVVRDIEARVKRATLEAASGTDETQTE